MIATLHACSLSLTHIHTHYRWICHLSNGNFLQLDGRRVAVKQSLPLLPVFISFSNGEDLKSESKSQLLSHVQLLEIPMDCSLSGSSIHRIFQARILEWVAISCSRASSLPRDRTQVSCIAGRFFANWAAGEDLGESKIMCRSVQCQQLRHNLGVHYSDNSPSLQFSQHHRTKPINSWGHNEACNSLNEIFMSPL